MNATRKRCKCDRAGRIAAVVVRVRARVSYASVALFIALGGTAAAVTAIPRDSIGSPQIRKDAVRSPEIAKDAVRSSEIRDGDIRLADISTGARNALQGAQGPAGPAGVTEVRVAESDESAVARCADQGLTDCPNLLTRTLGAGNWLIQAKLDVVNGSPTVAADNCGLVQGSSALDTGTFRLDAFVDVSDIESIPLTAVLTNAANGATVALRCSEQTGEDIRTEHMKITALKVTTVTGS